MTTQHYIDKVYPDETPVSGQVWDLPHFSTQAKFRVVYDGFREFHGKSINQETHTESDLLEPLLNVITCFRLGKYVVVFNLKECYVQIGISPEQQNLFRILWFAEDNLE